MKLYFVNEQNEKLFLAESDDLHSLNVIRRADMEQRGFSPEDYFYIRGWFKDNGMWIDFGSHSCFYFIEGATIADFEEDN